MNTSAKAPIRIIGIGNPVVGDDAIGIIAARRLRPLVGGHAEVLEAPQAGLDVFELLTDVDMVILIDAVYSGRTPGTTHRLDLSVRRIGRTYSSLSSHGVSVGEAVELARTLHLLPPRVVLYGIEISHVTPGTAVSVPVLAAVPNLLRQIRREMRVI